MNPIFAVPSAESSSVLTTTSAIAWGRPVWEHTQAAGI
jgi:hypothetical protein